MDFFPGLPTSFSTKFARFFVKIPALVLRIGEIGYVHGLFVLYRFLFREEKVFPDGTLPRLTGIPLLSTLAVAQKILGNLGHNILLD